MTCSRAWCRWRPGGVGERRTRGRDRRRRAPPRRGRRRQAGRRVPSGLVERADARVGVHPPRVQDAAVPVRRRVPRAAGTPPTCSATCPSTSTACRCRVRSSWVSTSPSRSRSAASVSAAVARRNIRRMARQFIAGADPQRAHGRVSRRLWDQGEAITVDLLGEQVVSEPEAQRYADRVVELVDVLAAGTRAWPTRDAPRARPVGRAPAGRRVGEADGAVAALRAARPGRRRWTPRWRGCARCSTARAASGATVHLDTEHDDAKDLGYELLRRMGSEYPDVQLGCVVQAYRKDSFADLRDLVAWSASALARAAAGPPGQGRLLGPRGDRRRRRRDGRRRCSRGRRRPTRTSSGARGT